MACIIKKSANQWNFITANVVNGSFITDPFEQLPFCEGIFLPPINLAVDAFTFNTVTISWELQSPAGAADIYRSIDDITYVKVGGVSSGITYFQDTGLTSSTLYYYKVKGAGLVPSDFSDSVSQTTAPTIAPTGLTDIYISDDGIQMQWTSNSGGVYPTEVYRSLDNILFSKVGDVTAGLFTFYDSGLDPLTTYYHKVREVWDGEPTDYSNTITTITTDIDLLIDGNGDFLIDGDDESLIN